MDRIRGAILGLACGDALGAPIEFQSREAVQAKWGRLTEMVGGGPWMPNEWTDDTGMMLCVAEGILENPDDPVEAVGARFLEWRRDAKDIGNTIRATLGGCRGSWAEASRSHPNAKIGRAASNGSLMRILPVALAESREAAQQGARTDDTPGPSPLPPGILGAAGGDPRAAV